MKTLIKKIIMRFVPSFRPQTGNDEQRRLGICINYKLQTDLPLVAITFDDGPSEGVNEDYLHSINATKTYDKYCTQKILKILEENNAKATFFICGEHVTEEATDTIKNIYNQGHELAVHCWQHGESVHHIPQPDLIDELMRTKRLITSITGSPPTCMRPPRGETEAVTTQLIFSHTGLRTILWQETGFDWLGHDPEYSVSVIMKSLSPGSIVLLHDIYKHTPKLLELLFAEMKKKELRCTTVSDLINHSKDLNSYMAIPYRP